MEIFDYFAAAELFPARSSKAFRWRVAGYHRFAHAGEAIRFAIEELPAELLTGAYLEVEGERFDRHGIRSLYDNSDYPFPAPRIAETPISLAWIIRSLLAAKNRGQLGNRQWPVASVLYCHSNAMLWVWP